MVDLRDGHILERLPACCMPLPGRLLRARMAFTAGRYRVFSVAFVGNDSTSNQLFVSINLELLTLPPKERKAVDMMTWRREPVALNGVVAAACHSRLSRSVVSVGCLGRWRHETKQS
jgi:hypothetical protein